jgi:hypothetical protein
MLRKVFATTIVKQRVIERLVKIGDIKRAEPNPGE